jgi:hypothetical protein
MASFLHPSYLARHPGVARIDSAVGAVRGGFDSTKGLSAMLLAAMVSALVVVADQLIETWADGHLMVAWVALWLVGFVALAVFAGAARKLAVTVVGALDAWSARVAQARADERLWAIAKTDPRVMADLSAAMARSEP